MATIVTRHSSVLRGVVLATVLFLTNAVPAGAAMEFKFPHIGTPTSWYHIAATKFAEIVAAKTKGEVKVIVIPGGQMGDQQDLLAGLQLGTIDFYVNDVQTMSFQDAGRDFNVLAAPYLFRDMGHYRKFIKSDTYRVMRDGYEAKSKIKVIGYMLDRSPRQLTTRDTAVKTPRDVKGLKLRVPQIQSMVAVWRAWGANPTIMPWIETINALRQGTVEGQENGVDLIEAFKLWESQKYFIKLDQNFSGLVLFTSGRRWQEWSSDLRRTMEQAVDETYTALNDKFWESEAKGIKELEANHMTVVLQPDREAFRKIAVEEMRKLDGQLWRKGLVDEILAIR